MSEPVIRKGKVVAGAAVGSVSSAGAKALKIPVQMAETEDVRVYDLLTSSGEDTNPSIGDTVFFLESGAARKSVVATRDQIPPTVQPGEKEIYSHTATAKLARHKFKANGKHFIAVQGGSDLGTQLGNLLSALVSLDTALTALASSLATGTLGSMSAGGTALGTAMASITTAINSAQTGIASVLDTTA